MSQLLWYLTAKTASATDPTSASEPVDLRSVGYHGTWDQFCDKTEIEKDLGRALEIRTLRSIICTIRNDKKIDASSLRMFAVYKYCVEVSHHYSAENVQPVFSHTFCNAFRLSQVRPLVDNLLVQLVSKFSADNEELREQIFNATKPAGDNTSSCYLETKSELDKHCIGQEVESATSLSSAMVLTVVIMERAFSCFRIHTSPCSPTSHLGHAGCDGWRPKTL